MALVVPADVTKKEDFKKVVSSTLEEFGSIDGIINNAGLMPLSYVKNLHTDEWDKMIDVNIKGVTNGVSAVLPTMMEQKRSGLKRDYWESTFWQIYLKVRIL